MFVQCEINTDNKYKTPYLHNVRRVDTELLDSEHRGLCVCVCGSYCFICLVGSGAYLLSLTLTNVTNKRAIATLKNMNNNRTPRRQCRASSWSFRSWQGKVHGFCPWAQLANWLSDGHCPTSLMLASGISWFVQTSAQPCGAFWPPDWQHGF